VDPIVSSSIALIDVLAAAALGVLHLLSRAVELAPR
jgi:hypothetical protein